MKISKEEKQMWLEDWRRSGKKAWTYAKENGLIPQTFCSWVKRAEEKRAAGFVEVQKDLIQPLSESRELVIETGELRIHLPITIWTLPQNVHTAKQLFLNDTH